MKKLLVLGDGYLQTTIIKRAKEMGLYVIACDMTLGNPGEKLADRFYNVSTTDFDAVLKIAEEEKIDGILTYASDVSAPTVSYVAEKMGLPCNPYQTVNIMTHKDLFHPFLKQNNFLIPKSAVVESEEDIRNFFDSVQGSIMIKPTDSSASRGVNRIDRPEDISTYFEEAKKYSRSKTIVVEEFIQRKGYQVAGDAFVVDGQVAFFGLANEHFDETCNPFVPIGESFPSVITESQRNKAKQKVQEALSILKYKDGAVNLDFMFDSNDEVFIIELGPRNGGNLITDAILLSNGVDLAECTIKAALGEDNSALVDKPMERCISSYVWHSTKDGVFDQLLLSDELQKRVVRNDMFVLKGQPIYRYRNGSFGLGFALIEYDNVDQMTYMMDHMNEYYRVKC